MLSARRKLRCPCACCVSHTHPAVHLFEGRRTLQVVPRSNLQLISVACMLIASKHEEERHPSVQDFTSIADNCFHTGDLLKMESLVLQSLGFRINSPTSHTFLSLFLQGVQLTPKAEAMAAYFTVCCSPSIFMSACMACTVLALFCCCRWGWIMYCGHRTLHALQVHHMIRVHAGICLGASGICSLFNLALWHGVHITASLYMFLHSEPKLMLVYTCWLYRQQVALVHCLMIA